MKSRPAPTVSGDLSETPSAQVLWQLRERGLSGTLSLHSPDGSLRGESMVVFDRGRVAQARLARPLDALGRILLERGTITPEQLDESLARLSAREGLQGEILVAMGACTPADVDEAMSEQLRRKIARLCALERGSFHYYSRCDLLPDFGGVRRPEDPAPAVWSGLKACPRHPAIDALLARIGTRALRLKVSPGELALFGLSPEELAAVASLERGGSGAALVRTGCPPLTARALVFLLALTRRVELLAPAPDTDEPGEDGDAHDATDATEVTDVTSDAGEPDAPPPPPVALAPAAPARPSRPRVTTRPAPPPRVPVVTSGSGVRMMFPEPPHCVSSEALPAVRRPSGRPSVPGLAQSAQEKLAKAEARLAAMQDESYFQMLGVGPEATLQAVKDAYLIAVARWHPDLVSGELPKLKSLHEKVTMLLGEARSALADEAGLESHRKEVAQGLATPNARREANAALHAAEDALRAELCLRRREFPEAERLARKALSVNRDDVSAMVVLATSLLEANPAGPFNETLVWLARALDLAPDNDRAHVLLGWVCQRQGEAGRALGHFSRALQCNPRNIDARREVRLAEMRRRAPPTPRAEEASGGFFSRLFKR